MSASDELAHRAGCGTWLPADDEWQPIETAPEGEWVLVADKREDNEGLRFYAARKESWHFEGSSGVNYQGPYADGYLCDLADINVEPTHWMPLPNPPSEHPAQEPPQSGSRTQSS